jgi:hypothetical protein
MSRRVTPLESALRQIRPYDEAIDALKRDIVRLEREIPAIRAEISEGIESGHLTSAERERYNTLVENKKLLALLKNDLTRMGYERPLLTDDEEKALAKALAASKAAAKPSFFGRLFGRRAPVPAAESAARVAERAARQIANAREADRGRLAGSYSFRRPPAEPLIDPRAAARNQRYSEYAERSFTGPPRYGGKTKRRHTKRRKSRKSRKSCK